MTAGLVEVMPDVVLEDLIVTGALPPCTGILAALVVVNSPSVMLALPLTGTTPVALTPKSPGLQPRAPVTLAESRKRRQPLLGQH